MRKEVLEIRQQFEERAIPRGELESIYKEYNSMRDIRPFIFRAKKLFPKLNCGLASAYLKSRLKKGSIVQGKYKSHPHTFLKVKSKIIDITADQYGGPRVYIGPLKKPWALRS